MRDEQLFLGEAPAVGFGEAKVVRPPTAAPPSPWTVALVTSVVGAATGWVIEEVARKTRERKRR
jgi:membrane protein YqaA with SNARE-associated domain